MFILPCDVWLWPSGQLALEDEPVSVVLLPQGRLVDEARRAVAVLAGRTHLGSWSRGAKGTRYIIEHTIAQENGCEEM